MNNKQIGRAKTDKARDHLIHVRLSDTEYQALKKQHNNVSHVVRSCIRKVLKINVKENNYQKKAL